MGVKTTNQREFRAYPVNQEKSIFKGNDDVYYIFYNIIDIYFKFWLLENWRKIDLSRTI